MDMIRDTILLGVALLILASLAALAVWDWREARKPDGKSLSDRALAMWQLRKAQPVFWLALGLSVGFVIGLVAGFVSGHLFWPQMIEV